MGQGHLLFSYRKSLRRRSNGIHCVVSFGPQGTRFFLKAHAVFRSFPKRMAPDSLGSLAIWAFLAAALLMTTPAKAELMKVDIVICGGSLSAPAAALQAARMNPEAKILLTEPTDWLGGQATSQGVSAIDNAWHNPGATLMREDPPSYYAADYLDFLDDLKNPDDEAPGEGMAPNGSAWVSREAYDPRTAARILDQMVEAYPNITLMKMAVVKKVETEDISDEFGPGKRITALELIRREAINGYQPSDKFLSEVIHDWYDSADSEDFRKETVRVEPADTRKGMVVIDASELGDTVVLSDAVYTVGRELASEKMGEDGSLPEMNEQGSQAFAYIFCVTDADTPSDESHLKTPFPDFESYYQNQVDSYFSLAPHGWARVWTYRRLRNTGPVWSFDTVNRGDVTMQNWYPGNDYPYQTMYKDKAGAQAESADWKGGVFLDALAEAEKHALAYYFYYKENRTSAWDTHYLAGIDELNMMGSATGLSKFPYIRGTRRIIGLHNFRLTGRYLDDTEAPGYDNGPSFRFYDSVGIGNYAVDVHPSSADEGIIPQFEKAAPFYIPYRALGSANVRNLLAGGKLIAGTFVTNAAYRVHPIEWAIGTAAGAASAEMAAGGASNYDLLERTRLRRLQADIDQNSPISWEVYDAAPIPEYNGEIIVNDRNEVSPGETFPLEIYHHTATRARVFVGHRELGETTERANGRLVMEASLQQGETPLFTAYCYDDGGELLDTVRNFSIERLYVVDNDDNGRFSLEGSWDRGTAQPDRFGGSYHYTNGEGVRRTATWDLYIPAEGTYEVSVWYPAAFNRAIDAPFTVHHADGTETVFVNQQINGGEWVKLGEFRFRPDGERRVVLSNNIAEDANLVIADAVRALPIANSDSWILSEKAAGVR